RLVFSSTCATYGKPQYLPIDEKHPQKPINPYGSSKLMVEEMLRALALSKGLKFACLRYFNAAGASDSGEIGESHEPETHLIPLALMAALGKIPQLKVYGDDYDTPDGTCIRDYIHVLDLAAAHCQALDLLKRPDFVGDMEESDGLGIAINLGTASGASVKEVIAQVEAVLDKPVPYQIEARRPGDPSRLVADNSKARRVLAWNPRYDLKRIIETAAQWELARRY
ncbi:MAG TPA: UDP-glucose 4-epimerase GalE, partial [Candidatus Obscuribacter sp.]|nr:UDP-glucose 4-epimerase GalE [Candidatus Obscuribacter sp.]